MRVIDARNPHEALIKGVHELHRFGIPRDSRNGPVLIMPTPVTTVYEHPEERVIFWPERDANPFFHLYEALWMLGGRQHVEPLLRYVKRMETFADNGIMHGAYGHRWRYAFNTNQLWIIIRRLKEDPNDRRSILQMWDTRQDLDKPFKDLPCNTMASVQINVEGRLDLTVFCRSNDIIWGAYGANAVHFSMLQEYLARGIGCPIGQYYQVSVNWHAYRNVFDKLFMDFDRRRDPRLYEKIKNPYQEGIKPTLMPPASSEVLDRIIRNLLEAADGGFKDPCIPDSQWDQVIWHVLRAHHIYKQSGVDAAIDSLAPVTYLNYEFDWVVAAKEWLARRLKNLDITTHSDPKPVFLTVESDENL